MSQPTNFNSLKDLGWCHGIAERRCISASQPSGNELYGNRASPQTPMLKGFFEWFNPRGFMNTPEEWHSFVVGFCEALCPLKPRIEPEYLEYVQGEWHYYSFGRALGFMALVVFIVGMVKVIWN